MKRAKPPVLRPHEEEEILKDITEKAKKGEPISREHVIDKVVQFIKSDNRKNPFRNGTPGDKWFSLFRRRHNSHFLKLKQDELKTLERIGFTEKVMNTVVYPKTLGMGITIEEYSTPRTRKRRPKITTSTPNKMTITPSSLSRSGSQESSGVVFTFPPRSEESDNTNTDDGDKTDDKSIINLIEVDKLEPGCKLEVMDFNGKWYPVKVMEVDRDEGEVLVHFEKWSDRYNEWIKTNSNRIRQPQLTPSIAKKVFVEDEKVIAVWHYGHKYPATVKKVLPNDRYEVVFYDGFVKNLSGQKLFKATEEDIKNIRLPSPKKPAPPMGADPLDPDLGPKEERRLKKRRLDVYEALRPQKKNKSDHSDSLENSLTQELPERSDDTNDSSFFPLSQPVTHTYKPKEMPKVVFRKRGRPRKHNIQPIQIKSEESHDDDDDDNDTKWLDDDMEDMEEYNYSQDLTQKKKRKYKKKMEDGSFGYIHHRPGLEEDSERWDTDVPEGAEPVQIKDSTGSYRESIIIPDKKLPPGWTKHTMKRKTGAKWDVFLVNESGRKFRSRNELRNYFAELDKPFPDESFDFMVGRKIERIRSQTESKKAFGGGKSQNKNSYLPKKSEGKGENSKDDFSPENKKAKSVVKGKTTDFTDEVKHEFPTKESPATTNLPFPIEDLHSPDGGYTCCGKSFRKENLFQMHMKHYHPEYSNLFGSTPNVADLAYARTVGEPLEDSRAEAMTPKNTLLERVTKYEAERKALSDATSSPTVVKSEPADDSFSQSNEPTDAVSTGLLNEKEKCQTPKQEIKIEEPSSIKENEEKNSIQNKTLLEVSEDRSEIEQSAEPEQLTQEIPVKEKPPKENIEKNNETESIKVKSSAQETEKSSMGETSTENIKIPPSPSPKATPDLQTTPSLTENKGVSKADPETESVQNTSLPKTLPIITKYVPPGQIYPKPPAVTKLTISADKQGKPTIKTLLPVRPPPATTESKNDKETEKSVDTKIKNEVESEKSLSQPLSTTPTTHKQRQRKRTFSESLPKKPKLAKAGTGSLEEENPEVKEAVQVPTPTSSANVVGSSSGSVASSGYRFSRNRTSVPRVSLEKLNLTPDSNGRVMLADENMEKERTPNTEGRRAFKKFKSANKISKRPKGEVKTENVDGPSASSEVVYENLRKEEIINCTCGYAEEDGLMIQCDLCLCWQHGHCNNIDKEEEVPEKYVCQICRNPHRQRTSSKFMHNQDWLKEGKLPSFSFLPKDPERKKKIAEREKILKESHDLMASVFQLEKLVHSLRVKTHIATMKQDHPKLYLWAKSWRNESSENKNEIEGVNNKEVAAGSGPQPEAAIDSTECRLRLLDHIEDIEAKVEDRLTLIEAQFAALEAKDPDAANGDVSDFRLKQTGQMLLRDLNTVRRFAALS